MNVFSAVNGVIATDDDDETTDVVKKIKRLLIKKEKKEKYPSNIIHTHTHSVASCWLHEMKWRSLGPETDAMRRESGDASLKRRYYMQLFFVPRLVGSSVH